MKIKSIWAKNAASIVDATIEIDLNGLTCISGANESGKSTLARVPYLIQKFKYTTNDDEIVSLRNIDNSGEPLILGMAFIVGDKHYSIEKSFLKSSTAVFRQTSPIHEQFENTAAENELKAVLSSVDRVLFKMLNLEQGMSIWLDPKDAKGKGISLDPKDSKSQTDSLSLLLDRATQPETDPAEDGFFIDLEKRYLQFFTPKGLSSTSANTKGSELKNLIDSQAQILKETEEFNENLRKISALSVNLTSKPDSIEISGISECQNRQAELSKLRSIRGEFDSATETLTQNQIEIPDNWSAEMHQTLEDTFSSFTAISSQGKLSIKALQQFGLQDEDENPNLMSGEVREYPLARTKKYVIGDLAEISVESEAINEKAFGEYEAHIAALEQNGVRSLKQSREILAKWNLVSKVNDLVARYGTFESILTRIQEIESYKSKNEALWERSLNYGPVTIQQAVTLTEDRTRISTQIDYLIENNAADRNSIMLDQLADIEKRIGKLELEKKTLDLIYRTVKSSRQDTRARLAPAFQRILNKLISEIYKDEFSVSISDELSITSRTKASTPMNVGRLSVGAKETLSILLRMAICRLADSVEPLPLILDDEFAYMDDTNIAAFVRYMTEVKDQQIILLTHQPEKFKSLDFIQI